MLPTNKVKDYYVGIQKRLTDLVTKAVKSMAYLLSEV